MSVLEQCLDQGSFTQVFTSAFALGFIVAVAAKHWFPSLFQDVEDTIDPIEIIRDHEEEAAATTTESAYGSFDIEDITFKNKSTINYVSCNHMVPEELVDGEMIDEIFGCAMTSEPQDLLDSFSPVSVPALARLLVLDCMFQSFPVEVDFYKVFSYLNKDMLIQYTENSKETIEVHFRDAFGYKRKRAFHPGDTIAFPIGKEAHAIDEPVLTKAIATFFGMEVILVDTEQEEEEDDEESNEEQEEEEKKEETDAASTTPEISKEDVNLLRGVWSELTAADTNTEDEDYEPTETETQEAEAEEEEEEEEEEDDSEPFEDENEDYYELDVLSCVSPWLRYKTDERKRLLPFLIRDIIASDNYLFDFTQELSVWGFTLNLKYSDGTIVSCCLDEKGYNESSDTDRITLPIPDPSETRDSLKEE